MELVKKLFARDTAQYHPASVEKIESALSSIPSDSREIWLKVGMAIKAEVGDEGFETWNNWSQQADSYDPRDARDVWKSIRVDGGVGIGTLFREAKLNGWLDDGASHTPTSYELAERKHKADQRAAKEKAKIDKERAETSRKARAVWKVATEAKPDHPYLRRKQISPVSTLREIDAGFAKEILGYAPNARGETLYGRLLVVPAKWNDEISTLELIDEGCLKTALVGRGSKTGAFWATERLPNVDGSGLTILIGEGVATVISAMEATGHIGIAALSSGNLTTVAKSMRSRYRQAVLVILADLVKATGEPEPHAIEAANAVGGLLAVPDFGPDRPEGATDFNDLSNLSGKDAVGIQIGAVLPISTPAAPERNLFVSVGDLIKHPPVQRWLVCDCLEMDSTALLFGESTAGKSFVALDMGCSVATGHDWHGLKVQQGAVFYVAGEGHGGLSKRFLAWQQHNAKALADAPIFLSSMPVELPDDQMLKNLMREIDASDHTPKLIIFDTLARSLIGDENNARDIGAFFKHIDRIRNKYGCCVLIVHHTGHVTSERARGSSALKASVDAELCLTMVGDLRQVTVTKQKDHEPAKPKFFNLIQTPLPWADDEGKAIISAVMVEADQKDVAGQARHKRTLSRREDAVLNALRRAIDRSGEIPSEAIKARFGGFSGMSNQNRMVAHLDRWRDEAYPIIDTDGDIGGCAKKKAFQRCRSRLQEMGVVQTMDDFWWIVRNNDQAGTPGRDGTNRDNCPDHPPICRDGTGHTPIGVSRLSRQEGDNGSPDLVWKCGQETPSLEHALDFDGDDIIEVTL